jgi:hypothetical protein
MEGFAMNGNIIRVFTTDGVEHIGGLGPWDRSTVARHWNAVHDFLRSGDPGTLRRLEAELLQTANGVLVGDVELTFDLDQIERDAFRGDTGFESIYES